LGCRAADDEPPQRRLLLSINDEPNWGCPRAPPEEIAMFRPTTFKGDAAFWPQPDSEKPAHTGGLNSLLWTLLSSPGRLLAAILAELRARNAMQALADLDERMLRDIGVERDQIPHVCRQGREVLLRPDLSRWA
jgi:uncharacterized protein YjiS (DUF1127 family)